VATKIGSAAAFISHKTRVWVTGRDSRGSGCNQIQCNIPAFFNIMTKENQAILNQDNWNSCYQYDHISNNEK
jgi:hypothetical protein